MNIAIIEDNKEYAQMLKDSIEVEIDSAKEVSLFESIEEARRKLSKKYGVFIVDVNLPDGDGEEFALSLQDIAGQGVSIILNSGYTSTVKGISEKNNSLATKFKRAMGLGQESFAVFSKSDTGRLLKHLKTLEG